MENVELSPYNVAHNEIDESCCGIFNTVNENKIVSCNECGVELPIALGYR